MTLITKSSESSLIWYFLAFYVIDSCLLWTPFQFWEINFLLLSSSPCPLHLHLLSRGLITSALSGSVAQGPSPQLQTSPHGIPGKLLQAQSFYFSSAEQLPSPPFLSPTLRPTYLSSSGASLSLHACLPVTLSHSHHPFLLEPSLLSSERLI